MRLIQRRPMNQTQGQLRKRFALINSPTSSTGSHTEPINAIQGRACFVLLLWTTNQAAVIVKRSLGFKVAFLAHFIFFIR